MKILDIKSPFKGALVYYKKETRSTMDDAEYLSLNGCVSGTVVTAGYQSHGRGRIKDRIWQSNPEENLLFTIIFKQNEILLSVPLISLLMGIAVSKALEVYSIVSQIKWPNDVLVNGKKISGIFCKASGRYIYAGIGINCNQNSFPLEFRMNSCSIAQVIGRSINMDRFLEKVLTSVYQIIFQADWKKDIEERLYKKGESITIFQGLADSEKTLTGRIMGIGINGELIFLPEGQKESIGIFDGEIADTQAN